MADDMTAPDEADIYHEALTGTLKPRHGITAETCSASTLNLQRFESPSTFYKMDKKSPSEQLLNPFGDPWKSRTQRNRFIPTMTGSLLVHSTKVAGVDAEPLRAHPSTARDYAQYSGHSYKNFHFDETICKLAPEMTQFREMKAQYAKRGLTKRFIGYAVINYDDHYLFGKPSNLPETYYVHKPEGSLRTEDRVRFKDGDALVASGEVFDIRQPTVRSAICQAILQAMESNGLDCVLIDYAVRRYAFGAPGLINDMPDNWFTDFQECQHALIKQLYAVLKLKKKLLFLNGIMLDSIFATEPALINMFMKICDGMFWEQPFRWEWRNFDNGQENYYERLQQFFDISHFYKKSLIVKSGTYRFHGTEDVIQGWNGRFRNTNHGIERHLADYATCFFLLYYNRHFDCFYHTHPTKLFDIYASEAYFKIWDTELGDALTDRIEYSPHVQIREFEYAFVCVNNTLKPLRLSPRRTRGKFQTTLPRRTVAPLSGTIIPKRTAIAREQINQVLAHAKASANKLVRSGK